MKKTLLIITSSILMQLNMAAQSKTGIENYHFLSSGEAYVWMPVAHHLGKKGMYTELRYNYEALKTGSVYMGKNFSKKGAVDYSFTPMLGLVFGKFNGGSVAMNMEVERKKTFISMQTQYTVSRDAVEESFFFNWIEFGYQPREWFYTGVSTQLTKMHKEKIIPEYGVFVGFVMKKFTIPVYIFNPLSNNKTYIIGINAEW